MFFKKIKKKCPKPGKVDPEKITIEERRRLYKKYKLPNKNVVKKRLYKIVKDKNVRFIIEELIDTIYMLDYKHDFMAFMLKNMELYNINDKNITDYILAMTLAFITYCNKYGEKDVRCLVVAQLNNELKITNKREALSFAKKWKKETDKIVKLWKKIEKTWCLSPAVEMG